MYWPHQYKQPRTGWPSFLWWAISSSVTMIVRDRARVIDGWGWFCWLTVGPCGCFGNRRAERGGK